MGITWQNARKQVRPARGKSLDEAIKNLKEATELYLEEFPLKRYGNPVITVFEVASHA
jgi:predicted RNase H-like HicB family nuclease